MTIRQTLEIETITCIIVTAFLGSFFVWRNNQNFQNKFHITTPIDASNAAQSSITPTSTPVVPVTTAFQISPDGTKNLTMRTTHNPDGTVTYAITSQDTATNIQIPVYTTTLQQSETLRIPFNTWSPDNKYVFIQKDTTDALVFTASGAPIDGNQPYFDIANAFAAKNIPNTPAVTTGWASPTLLIVNTTKPDATTGPSYWFEVPSQAIIVLSSQF